MSLLRSQFKRIVIAQATPAARFASYSFSPVQRMKEENEVAKRKVSRPSDGHRPLILDRRMKTLSLETSMAKPKKGYYRM